MEQLCEWCNPNMQGEYAGVKFTDESSRSALVMFFNGAQVTLRITGNDGEQAHMSHPINFCPMCGKRVRTEVKQ